jgi:hypothetical protein
MENWVKRKKIGFQKLTYFSNEIDLFFFPNKVIKNGSANETSNFLNLISLK